MAIDILSLIFLLSPHVFICFIFIVKFGRQQVAPIFICIQYIDYCITGFLIVYVFAWNHNAISFGLCDGSFNILYGKIF